MPSFFVWLTATDFSSVTFTSLIIILNCLFHFNKEISGDYNSKLRSYFFIFRISKSKWNFLFFNFELVTQKWKNKSLTIELVNRSEIFFFNFELVTQKWKNKSLIIELVTRSETFYFSTSS